MARKAKLKSLDGLSEAEKTLYVERDGEFVLDVDAEEAASLFSPALVSSRDKVISEKRALQAQLAAFSKLGASAEELADLKAAAERAAEEKAAKAGDFEKLKTEITARHAQEKASLEGRISKLTSTIERIVGERQVLEAITSAGGNPKLLMDAVMKQIKVAEEGEEFVAQVIYPNGPQKGTPRAKDGQGAPMTIADLVQELRGSEDYAPAFRASQASGSSTPNGRPAPTGGTKTVSVADQKSFLANLAAIAKNEVSVQQ